MYSGRIRSKCVNNAYSRASCPQRMHFATDRGGESCNQETGIEPGFVYTPAMQAKKLPDLLSPLNRTTSPRHFCGARQ